MENTPNLYYISFQELNQDARNALPICTNHSLAV